MKREVDLTTIKDDHRALANHLNEKALELIGGILDKHVAVVLEELHQQTAKLAKVRVLRDEVNSFTRSPQKKDHKERARELGNCIANIKNDLDAILEERTS